MNRPAHAVVFGKVVEGMALVRKTEATGTQSGKPRQPVLIADSGEVTSPHRSSQLLAFLFGLFGLYCIRCLKLSLEVVCVTLNWFGTSASCFSVNTHELNHQQQATCMLCA